MSDDHAPLTYISPVDYAPRRVVSLVPSLTESLFDLDLGDRLIAITDDCIHPAEKVQYLPRVGGIHSPNIDQIINLQPDLVLLNLDDNRPEDIEALQTARVPVWITGPRTVFDALNVLWSIMDVFDHPVMVPRVREIERAYDYTSGAASAQAPVPVVALLGPCQPGTWITVSAAAFAHDLLRVCGGRNMLADMAKRPNSASPDELTAAQPDVILIAVELEADLDQLHALDVPAAHNGRIHVIDGTLLTWHGTRIAFALRDLPAFFMEEEAND